MKLWIVSFLLPLLTHAGDWPQFLGPHRDGIYDGPPISTNWNSSEPKTLWKKKVGEGFSAPVISQGKLFLFHRLDDQEVVTCLNSTNGSSLWQTGYAAT